MFWWSESHHHLDANAKHVRTIESQQCVWGSMYWQGTMANIKTNTYEWGKKNTKLQQTTNPTNSKRLYYVWQTIDQKVSAAPVQKGKTNRLTFVSCPLEIQTKGRPKRRSLPAAGTHFQLISFDFYRLRDWNQSFRGERFDDVFKKNSTKLSYDFGAPGVRM